MVEVIGTEEFEAWFAALSKKDADAVIVAVDILAERGVALGFPQSSDIKGSRFAMRELRVQSQGHPLRIFYAFDPLRQAVLLLGADKTGQKRFYEKKIREAEAIWLDYLKGIT